MGMQRVVLGGTSLALAFGVILGVGQQQSDATVVSAPSSSASPTETLNAGLVADVSSLGAGRSQSVGDTSSTEQVGALFRNGSHFCTASVVRSQGRDLLVTAAHCVAGGAAGLTFAPGYHDGRTPYGVWTVTRLFTDAAWQSGQNPDDDVAFAEVAPLDGRQVQDVVGGAALDTDRTADGSVTLVGYPSSADEPLVCGNSVTTQSSSQLEIACDAYSGGTSGSPWLTEDDSVIGVIGGYQQGGDTADVSYSPIFGSSVRDLYDTAAAATQTS